MTMSDVGKKWREGHFGGAVKWLILSPANIQRSIISVRRTTTSWHNKHKVQPVQQLSSNRASSIAITSDFTSIPHGRLGH
jgi:hypothetical protein